MISFFFNFFVRIYNSSLLYPVLLLYLGSETDDDPRNPNIKTETFTRQIPLWSRNTLSLGQKRHFENQSSFESDATSSDTESKNPITSYPFLTTNSTP